MAVTITEILGTDSISGSRLTINANFLLLENAYNDLEDSFNINVLTGSLDVSNATSGQIKAKSLVANSLVMPASGTTTIQVYGTGASAGYMIASDTVASPTGTFSNTLHTNLFSASGSATFGSTVTFNSVLNNNGRFTIGTSGNIANKNRKASVGITTNFPSAPGAGLTGTYANPYVPTGTENVVYINSAFSSGGYVGFFMQSTTGPGTTVSTLPSGFTLTLIDTATSAGKIATGVTGGGSTYYTGFSTGDGGFTSPAILTPGDKYKSSLTLMWEPRINGGGANSRGSWVVVSCTQGFTF